MPTTSEATISMRPPQTFANVTDRQYQHLLAALHQQWRVALRAVMILLSADGMGPTEIATLLHCDPVTVRRWITRHDTEGLTGLPDRPRTGRPRHGSTGLGERIRTLLMTPKAWTTARIWRALDRPAISLRTMYRRIREHATWRRPRLTAKSDPDHDRICARIRNQLRHLPAGAIILAEDETYLEHLAKIRASWMPFKIRHRIDTPGRNTRRSLYGALNLATGAWHYHPCVNAVSEVFCYFLQRLLDAYPNAPTVVVLADNDTTHTSRYTRAWLTEHPRLHLILGAKYSPQDNPTERIWAALKRHIANTAVTTVTDRIRQAHRFFRPRTPDQNLATAAPWTSPWLPHSYRQNFWPGA